MRIFRFFLQKMFKKLIMYSTLLSTNSLIKGQGNNVKDNIILPNIGLYIISLPIKVRKLSEQVHS